MTRNLLKRLDKTSRYVLYLDEKTLPGVNIIVRRIYGRLFLYLMNSTEIGRHLHKDERRGENNASCLCYC